MVDASDREGGAVSVAVALVLGAGWGLVAATPFAIRARRCGPGARVAGLAPEIAATPRRRSEITSRLSRVGVPGAAGAVGRVARAWRVHHARHRLDAAVGRELPVVLDLLGVAVAAGCTPYLAVEAAARWAPPVLSDRLAHVSQVCQLGGSFPDALDELASETPRLGPLVDALLASDRLGAPVGPALARLADEERAATRRAAEAHARRVPVRLLFPLVFLVLPAFGLLTVVPALLSGLART